MKNILLHSLTNRFNDFNTPVLNDSYAYVRKVLSSDIIYTMNKLGLNNLKTDYYVISLLQTLFSSAVAMSLVNNNFDNYSKHIEIEPPSFNGIKNFVNNKNILPSVGSDDVEVYETMFYYDTAMKLGSVNNTGYVYSRPCVLYNDKLMVTWDETESFKGNILLTNAEDWKAGFSFTVISAPRCDYASNLIKLVGKDKTILRVLDTQGLSSMYALTRHPSEKLALIAAAIILSNNYGV